ncbi:uncharacterized protein O3C94_012563 [Discoglossus pictus]
MSKMYNNKRKMTERIVNHALQIIYLLTGEEYTIVKKYSPHSSIHQLTGQCHINVHKEVMAESPQIPRMFGIPTDSSSGFHEGNANSVSEEGEDELDETDILQVTIHTDLSTGPSNLKPSDHIQLDQEEELNVRSHQRVKREGISTDDNEGLTNMKPSIFSEHGQEEINLSCQQQVKEEDMHINISNDGSITKKNNEHQVSNTPSAACALEDISIPQNVDNANQLSINPSQEDFNKPINIFVGSKLLEKSNAIEPFMYENIEDEAPLVETSSHEMNKVQKYHSSVHISNCDQAGRSTTNKSPYQRDTIKRVYTCPECQKRFITNLDLVKHQAIHRNDRTYPCSACGKSFARFPDYVRHERIHTGEKPYSCSNCGKCFGRASSLVRHQRIHTGEKPFSCSDCGKCFIQKSDLVIHQSVHTGNKPFTCTACGKCFTQKLNLLRHQKVHIGEDIFRHTQYGGHFNNMSNSDKDENIDADIKKIYIL